MAEVVAVVVVVREDQEEKEHARALYLSLAISSGLSAAAGARRRRRREKEQKGPLLPLRSRETTAAAQCPLTTEHRLRSYRSSLPPLPLLLMARTNAGCILVVGQAMSVVWQEGEW